MDPARARWPGIAGAPDATARGFSELNELPTAIAVLAPMRDEHGVVADLVVAYANRAAAAIAGVAVEELPGRGIRSALAPELFERVASVLDDGTPLRARLDRVDGLAGLPARGGRFDFSASRMGELLLVACEDLGARMRGEATERRFGAVLEHTSDWVSLADADATIARDMTQERAAEAALRRSEERFRTAFEQAPIGMSLVGLDGSFVHVNDAYCATVRRSREELLGGLGPADITHPDDVPYTREAIRALMAGEGSVLRWEKRYVDRAGEAIWVEISATVFRDADGRPQYLNGMLQDLSERRIAHTLQRSMLTTQLPAVDDVELAVRYLPSGSDAEVGGDWYDVIPLPGGRVGLAIGDVVGRGVEAAATMSQLRTALRAYAVDGLEPRDVVAKLHRLVDHLNVGMSTLVYLDFDPFTREARYVSAGHLPVLHVPAHGESRFVPGARSTPLGTAAPGVEIPQERLMLEPGDSVLLYTDGLVERRDERLDSRLEQLRCAVAEAPHGLEEALEHLTATLASDEALRHDDVALLALRVAPETPDAFAVTIQPVAEQLGALRGDLRAWLAQAGATASETGEVLIAVGEACANAIEHARAASDTLIDVRGRLVGREVVLRVRDHGSWRPPQPQPERGHGLRLMRVLMDGLDITSGHDGTRVELRRTLASGAGMTAARDDAVHKAAGAAAILSFTRERGVPVARLEGEVDLSATVGLDRTLAAEVRDADRGLVVDLDDVEYLDSAGLHLLHDAARTLGARGQELRVAVAPDAAVMRLLQIVDIEQAIPLDASVQAAVDALAPSLL